MPERPAVTGAAHEKAGTHDEAGRAGRLGMPARYLPGDEKQKAADRISAAKALIEYGRKAEAADEGAVRVVLEGVPKEYLV